MEREKEDISISKILIFSILITVIPIFYVYFFHIPQIQDISINTDPNIYAGLGEVCKTPSIEVKCQEELICIELTNKPYVNAICLPSGYELPEDFTHKWDQPGQKTGSLIIDWKGDKREIFYVIN